MELNKENRKKEFIVLADDKEALQKAIADVNLQSGSDYQLIHHEVHEVGLGTISVSEEKIIPEFLFMMGVRYRVYCKTLKINS